MNTAVVHTLYVRRSRVFFLNDAENPQQRKVDFHVQTGDAFAMFATAMGALEDSLNDCVQRGETPHSFHLMLLNQLKEDFKYLQHHYRIVRDPN